jgi:hypothetical protein
MSPAPLRRGVEPIGHRRAYHCAHAISRVTVVPRRVLNVGGGNPAGQALIASDRISANWKIAPLGAHQGSTFHKISQSQKPPFALKNSIVSGMLTPSIRDRIDFACGAHFPARSRARRRHSH